jgi:hypothetical protein
MVVAKLRGKEKAVEPRGLYNRLKKKVLVEVLLRVLVHLPKR